MIRVPARGEKPPGVLVENHRGCDIYWYSPGTWFPHAVYDSPCVPDMVFRDPQELIRAIDEILGPETPATPKLAIPIVLGIAALLLLTSKK